MNCNQSYYCTVIVVTIRQSGDKNAEEGQEIHGQTPGAVFCNSLSDLDHHVMDCGTLPVTK